jgi:DHA2 family multidrug resistance protein
VGSALDRSQTRDWFESPEIVVEAMIALTAFWIFLVHMFTDRAPLVSPQIFRDLNFVLGLGIMFLLGVVILATMALLPTFLQTLLGYPVQAAGWLLAPRGVGTMLGMLIVGQMSRVIAPHRIVGLGVLLLSGSLWQMSGFNFNTGQIEIAISGVIQGFGMGFVFVPVGLVTFYTLEPRFRTDGASLYSLVRNIGGSIGLSIVVSYLARATQTNHAILTEHVTPFSNAAEIMAGPAAGLGVDALVLLEGEVARQAAMLAYVQDFEFMALATLVALPMMLMLKPMGGR